MTVKQEVLKAVEVLGAEMEYGKVAGGVFEITIDAPEGQHWLGDGLHCLVESQDYGQPPIQLWRDALDRMSDGLESCNPSDPNCQDHLGPANV